MTRSVNKNEEVACLCGLLHNIGVPLLLQRLGELAPDLTAPDVTAILDAQTATAGAHVDAVAVAACGAALGRWMCDRSLLIADVLELPAIGFLSLHREDVDKLLENQDDIRISMESMVL